MKELVAGDARLAEVVDVEVGDVIDPDVVPAQPLDCFAHDHGSPAVADEVQGTQRGVGRKGNDRIAMDPEPDQLGKQRVGGSLRLSRFRIVAAYAPVKQQYLVAREGHPGQSLSLTSGAVSDPTPIGVDLHTVLVRLTSGALRVFHLLEN